MKWRLDGISFDCWFWKPYVWNYVVDNKIQAEYWGCWQAKYFYFLCFEIRFEKR